MNYKWLVYLLLACNTFCWAQTEDEFLLEDTPSTYNEKPKRIFTKVGIGSSVMYNSQKNYAFSTYLHPQISYQMSSRFEISMGLMAVRSNINAYAFYNPEGIAENIDYQGISAYYTLQGAYLLNENLKIYGGVMVGKSSFTTHNNQDAIKHRPKAYLIGLNYQLGENSFLQLEFQFREGHSFNRFQNHLNSRPFDHPFDNTLDSPFMQSNFD